MKFYCPTCRQQFLPENINVQTDIALCKACGNVSRLSNLVDMEVSSEVLRNLPKGTWYEETVSGCVFGATTRHPMAFFLVPFMCVWSGFSLSGIYGSQIIKRQFNLTTSLFGIPFLLGSLLFWSIALMTICGKVEVRVDDGAGTVFVGVGRLGWKRQFRLDEVDSIEDKATNFRYPGGVGEAIVLRGNSSLSFGTNLTVPRRHFMRNVLKRLKAQRVNH
jgi:hypothetical protein